MTRPLDASIVRHAVLQDLHAQLRARIGVTAADILQSLDDESRQVLDWLKRQGLLRFHPQDQTLYFLQSLELLEPERIQQSLAPAVQAEIQHLHCFASLPSTNDYLKTWQGEGSGCAVCLAEHQSAGRGRRGKCWASPLGQNIYLSLRRRVHLAPDDLGLVSLAVGIAVAQVVSEAGIGAVQVKWPNDIYVQNKKLAGVLIDAQTVQAQHADVVIGLGLNVRMRDDDAAETIDQPWTALQDHCPGKVSRNALVTALLNKLLPSLGELERHGYASLSEDWRQYDYLANKAVRFSRAKQWQTGVAQGIDERGALLVKAGQTCHVVNAGEVSVRPIDKAAPA